MLIGFFALGAHQKETEKRELEMTAAGNDDAALAAAARIRESAPRGALDLDDKGIYKTVVCVAVPRLPSSQRPPPPRREHAPDQENFAVVQVRH